MIELAMIAALGFLAASLLALAALPIVSRRARRLAAAQLETQMPLSMPEIAAERDQLRAAHAVAVRSLEQRIDALDDRNATAMSKAGRQATQLIALEKQHSDDVAAMADRVADLAVARAALRDAEATASAQAVALHDATLAVGRGAEKLDAMAARLAAAETLVEDQRTLLADLQRRLEASAMRPAPDTERPVTLNRDTVHLLQRRPETVAAAAPVSPEPAPAAVDGPEADPPDEEIATPPPVKVRAVPLIDDTAQLRASLSRFKAEQEFARRNLAATIDERDRLRLRVDQMLLQIEDLQDRIEDAGEKAEQDQRHAARQDKAIAVLKARVVARDEALVDSAALLAEERARHDELRKAHERLAAEAIERDPSGTGGLRTDAELRQAISALSAHLVRHATTAPPEPALLDDGPAGESV